MPWCPFAEKKPLTPGRKGFTDAIIQPRVFILHTAVSNARSLWGWFNSQPIEAHGYVLKNGHIEQYYPTQRQADANLAANDFANAWESQGYAYEKWTRKQIDAWKHLIRWEHKVEGIPMQKIARWDGEGVGYHSQFPPHWAGYSYVCPGEKRIRQYNEIIVPWLNAGAPDTKPEKKHKKQQKKDKDKSRRKINYEARVDAEPGSRPINLGSVGSDVEYVQRWLGIEEDGWFGYGTQRAVRKYQKMRGIKVDGSVGPVTWSNILGDQHDNDTDHRQRHVQDSTPVWGEWSSAAPGARQVAQWRTYPQWFAPNSVGSDVQYLQRFFGISDDGYFGENTKAVTITYQQNQGIEDNGVVGPVTWGRILSA